VLNLSVRAVTKKGEKKKDSHHSSYGNRASSRDLKYVGGTNDVGLL